MGIEQATARVRELRTLADALRTGEPAAMSLAPGQSAASADCQVSGDLDGLDPLLRASLGQVASKLGRTIEIVSSA